MLMPPVETAAAMWPSASSATAPTVSSHGPRAAGDDDAQRASQIRRARSVTSSSGAHAASPNSRASSSLPGGATQRP